MSHQRTRPAGLPPHADGQQTFPGSLPCSALSSDEQFKCRKFGILLFVANTGRWEATGENKSKRWNSNLCEHHAKLE